MSMAAAAQRAQVARRLLRELLAWMAIRPSAVLAAAAVVLLLLRTQPVEQAEQAECVEAVVEVGAPAQIPVLVGQAELVDAAK